MVYNMKLQSLMRPEINDEWGIKELQNGILNITKYIHDFCCENGIQYCIMGGTALGAVRHGGFIPWDDDVDLFMTPEEYFKFRDCFNKRGDKANYHLQEMGESNGKVVSAKLRLNDSFYVEEMAADWDIHHGVFVDIMIQLHYPNKWLPRKWFLFWDKYLKYKAAANLHYKKRGRIVEIGLTPLRLLPKRFLLDYALKQIWRYRDSQCDNYFHLYRKLPLSHSIYPKNLFGTYKLINFETIQLYVPIGVHEYLTILFGDYMTMPDIEKIRWNQHALKWSLTEPMPNQIAGSFSDEKYYWS